MNKKIRLALFIFLATVGLCISQAVGEDLPAVKVIAPSRKEDVRKIELPGTLEPLAEVTLFAKTSGYLESLQVDIGDWIKKGELICRIAVPELIAELEQLEARVKIETHQLELARLTSERLAKLHEDEPGAVTSQQVDEAAAGVRVAEGSLAEARAKLEAGKALVGYAEIRSPFNGIIIERNVDVGDFIQSAAGSGKVMPLGRVMNIDSIRIFVNLPEEWTPIIASGSPAAIKMDAFPGTTIPGMVSRVAGALDPATRTMRTEIRLPNPDHKLRPGMYAHVKLDLKAGGALLTLPSSAVSLLDKRQVVYVVRGQTVKAQTVSTGYDDGKVVEVISGLNPEDRVVVAGREGLKDDQQVRVIEAAP